MPVWLAVLLLLKAVKGAMVLLMPIARLVPQGFVHENLVALVLPQTAIPVALLFFNVGVEVGQLLFIAGVFIIIALARQIMRRLALPQPAWAGRVPPYAIGSVAAFWMIQRIVAF